MIWCQLRVDAEVRSAIEAHGKYGDSINDILRRILNMPQLEPKKPGPKRKEVSQAAHTMVPTKRARS